jgi:hypothetical protein
VGEALGRFVDELSKAGEEGKISSSAAEPIDRAVDEVVAALREEGMLATASPPPPAPEEGDEDSSGPGSEGHGHGPPAHAEANGRDEDGSQG